MSLFKKNKKNRVTFLGITSRALMLIAACLLAGSYLSMFVNPAKVWFMTVFGLLFAPLVFLNLFLLIWAAVRLSRTIFIPLIALLPSFFLIGRYIQFSGNENLPEGNVKILSYNVGRFSLSAKKLHIKEMEECADSVMAFLTAQDADIICLQEFAMSDDTAVKSYLKSRFEGYDVEYYVYPTDKGCYGNATLSRFPLKGKGKLDFDSSSNLALYSDYDIFGTDLRVYNCHFQSYNVSIPHIVNSIRNKEMMKNTEEKVKRSIVTRPRQVDMVMADIENCPIESIVVGDFNDNPVSYTYYRLSKGRKDSFVDAGRGISPTYYYLWPMLRIDYILYPKRFQATGYKVFDVNYSDHYPIMSVLNIYEPSGE